MKTFDEIWQQANVKAAEKYIPAETLSKEMFLKEHLNQELKPVMDFYNNYFVKPVVPKDVAVWYEANRKTLEASVYELHVAMHENKFKGKVREWFNDPSVSPMNTIFRMKFGYEIEKEPVFVLKQGRFYIKEWGEEDDGSDDLYTLMVHKARPFTKEELEETEPEYLDGFEIEEVKGEG